VIEYYKLALMIAFPVAEWLALDYLLTNYPTLTIAILAVLGGGILMIVLFLVFLLWIAGAVE